MSAKKPACPSDAHKEEPLPQKEFLLLFTLLSYPGKIFTRRALMDEIWDMTSETDERTVDVHVNRLREMADDFGIIPMPKYDEAQAHYVTYTNPAVIHP